MEASRKHRVIRVGLAISVLLLCALGAKAAPTAASQNGISVRSAQVWIALSCGDGCLWRYGTAGGGPAHSFAPPVFEADGKQVVATPLHFAEAGKPIHLDNGVTEYAFEGALTGDSHLSLRIEFQVNDDTPVVRFRYTLRADVPHTMTAPAGENRLTYFATSLRQFPEVKEISLSNFMELSHSYTLGEQEIAARNFEDSSNFMGPILAASDGRHSFLVAYEHGSEAPFAFLHYQLSPDRGIRLAAVKGNYFPGQTIDADHSYSTVWLETAAVAGDMDQLASNYRRFVLKSMAVNTATRTPYIYYNTYGHQERNKWWNGNWWEGNPYPMNQENILKEIDVAHRMGVDVFVIDGGWFQKTGDWTTVDSARFPDELKDVKAKLDSYGMKLGLWIGPTLAAESSKVVLAHPEWRMSWQGSTVLREESKGAEKIDQMCLASDYADYLADELIWLAKEKGVRYFKWDMIHQYQCDDPHHNHGGANNTEQERADSYAFQLVQYMSHIADKVAAAVPGTIVDFDVTEPERAMGLGFLASGKYFLMNNGPYYRNYDIPNDHKTSNPNVFFFPGQARAWIARSPLTYDKWIPSVLFLTHYFSDDPVQWQEVSVASLILGQNGIWGDLLNVSDAGVNFIGGTLAKYKQVRDDITASDPVVTGIVSGSPEIHEKISATNGRGAVVIFATVRGTYEYVTHRKTVEEHWSTEGVHVTHDKSGRSVIEASFDKPGAKIVFFGVH
jgi:alpha-galactosidase